MSNAFIQIIKLAEAVDTLARHVQTEQSNQHLVNKEVLSLLRQLAERVEALEKRAITINDTDAFKGFM